MFFRRKRPQRTTTQLERGNIEKVDSTYETLETQSTLIGSGVGREINPIASSEIQLLALPGGSSTQAKGVTVYPPQAGEHHVSILVDKEMESGYDLLDPQQSSLPALIRKDERSINRLSLPDENYSICRANPVRLNPGVKRSLDEVQEGWALPDV